MSRWYYDRDGKPIADLMTWERMFDDLDYHRVAQTKLANGTWVSTVWLGLNHAFRRGPPLIFETMVFSKRGDGNESDCKRYSTLAEAQAGHEVMVAKWAAAIVQAGKGKTK